MLTAIRSNDNLRALVMLASLAVPLFAEGAGLQEAGGAGGILSPPTFEFSFDRLWHRYREAERQGSTEAMQKILEEIRRLRVERNTFRLHDVALSFTFKGSTHLARGELKSAEENFKNALALDPTLPAGYLGLAQVARRSGATSLLDSVGHTVEAYGAAFRSLWNGYYAMANVFLLGVVSLFIVTSLLAGLMLYRYVILFEHDLAERFGERYGNRTVRAIVLTALLLPLAATAGFGWLAPYWLVLTFAYQARREKILSVAALVFLFLLAPLLEFYVLWSRTLVNPLFRASISSETGSFEPTDVLVLESGLRQYPEDRELKFILATQYRNLGEYDRSASLYREILTARPDDLAARINLGNIYFAQRDWDGAIFHYRKATESHPDSALAFYNESLAHAEKFEFPEREAARAKADSLDEGLVASFEQMAGGYRAVADLRLETGAILAKFFGLEQDRHPGPPPALWSFKLLAGQSSRFLLAALLLGGLLALLHYRWSGWQSSRRCWKCRSPFCRRCQIGTGRRGLCTQCYHLFVVKDGVSTVARNEKLSLVQRSAQTRTQVFRVLSLVVPGAGHVAEGMPLFGVTLLFLWVGGGVFLALGSRLYPMPDDLLGLAGNSLWYLLALTTLGALAAANTVGQPRLGAVTA